MSDFDRKDKRLADAITIIVACGFVCVIVFVILLLAYGIRKINPDTVASTDYWIVYFTAGLFGTSVLGIFVSAGAALIVKRTLEVNAELLRATRSEEMRRLRSYIDIEPPVLANDPRLSSDGDVVDVPILRFSVLNSGATPARVISLQYQCGLIEFEMLGQTLEGTFASARGDHFMVDGVGLPSPFALSFYLSAKRTHLEETTLDPRHWKDPSDGYFKGTHVKFFWASIVYADIYEKKWVSEFAYIKRRRDEQFRPIPPFTYDLKTDHPL